MPKRSNRTRVTCQHFVWLVGKRHGVYFADGRGNTPSLGRHSLGTRDLNEAMDALRQLDHIKALELGRVVPHEINSNPDTPLSLAEGWSLYMDHVGRPRVTGGAKPATLKRYHAVRDKFCQFAESAGLASWNQVTEAVLTRYASWLEQEEYAYATQYLELTTLKQVLKWLANSSRIEMPRITLQIAKPRDTDTYCWRPEEVEAIVAFCHERKYLRWLGDICMALACTGLRISELASLRWTDIQWGTNVIRLTDESTLASKAQLQSRRQTKSGRSRSFPIHPDLRRVLERLEHASDGVVFHGPRGGRVKADTVRRILVDEVLTRLANRFPAAEGERGFKDGRFHSFRHYFCSVSSNAGVPELVVMRWLGHRQSEMVHRYYHLHDQESQRYMQRLEVVPIRDAAG